MGRRTVKSCTESGTILPTVTQKSNVSEQIKATQKNIRKELNEASRGYGVYVAGESGNMYMRVCNNYNYFWFGTYYHEFKPIYFLQMPEQKRSKTIYSAGGIKEGARGQSKQSAARVSTQESKA